MNQVQWEASLWEFLFSFFFFNVILCVSFLCARDCKIRQLPWLLALFFCVFAFWDTDYYSFRYFFYHPVSDFRDPLYYYLTYPAFGIYPIYRLIIWGCALYLFRKTCNRFGVNGNVSAYVFVAFFLLTFSFARASLGMALYFYGLSLLLKPNLLHRVDSYLWGIVFILLSYFGHRSMLPLIVMTPLAFVKITRFRIFLLLCLFPLMIWGIRTIMLYFIDLDSSNGQLGEFSDAVRSYATSGDFVLNWKFALITFLRNASHYLLCAYLLWMVWLKRSYCSVPLYIKRFVTFSIAISCIAVSLSLSDIGVATVTSKRYLYMTGIPLSISLVYLVQEKKCSWRILNLLLIPSYLWAEAFFIGKLFSYYL